MESPKIRDIIYFDFEKASSIWSQFQWGKLEKLAVSTEEDADKKLSVEAGVPKVVGAKIEIGEGEKRTILETRILHHDLLNRIESFLSSNGLVVDLNKVLSPTETSPQVIRDRIGSTPFVIATGWSTIEDYKRLLTTSENFNALTEFISRSQVEGIKKTPEFLALAAEIDEKKKAITALTDRNEKVRAKAQKTNIDYELDQFIKQKSMNLKVEQWILDGVKLWISVFAPTRINFHVYPLPNCPSFQVLCNLKRESFVDQDFEHLIYAYGTRPNIPLSIFGLITSIPPQSNEPSFDPLSEFVGETKLSNEMHFEKAFRAMFPAFDNMEAFFRYSHYPNITVHPIAVFRDLAQGTNIETEKHQ